MPLARRRVQIAMVASGTGYVTPQATVSCDTELPQRCPADVHYGLGAGALRAAACHKRAKRVYVN